MAFNGSGTYSLYTPGNPVVSGTTIDTSWGNNTLNDIATALTLCITKDGQQTTTAIIPFASGISCATINVNSGGAVSALTQSSYTPTISNTTNVAASTMRVTGWVRIANKVIVSGTMDIDVTAAALTTFDIDLPVASNISNIFEVGGAASTVDGGVRIYGVVGNPGKAEFTYTAVTTTNQTLTFIFGYTVA